MEKRPESDMTREEINMFDGDKINTASKTLSPNDIRKACEGWTLTFKPKDGAKDIVDLGEIVDTYKRLDSGVGVKFTESDSQTAKADAGKAEIRLVPMEIVWAIAWIRMYGNRKYGDPENWKTVEPERYRDAMMRHLLAYISDPKSVDEESGYPHLWHAACNLAFLMHFDYGEEVLHDPNKTV